MSLQAIHWTINTAYTLGTTQTAYQRMGTYNSGSVLEVPCSRPLGATAKKSSGIVNITNVHVQIKVKISTFLIMILRFKFIYFKFTTKHFSLAKVTIYDICKHYLIAVRNIYNL